ncbi:DUF202 domain-containing protein [Salinactinospora qingdaonensis]|uniref:DUF202 domain-containing protein n=1 Tax=Salinactinospora qingdaonensis TaxID=702744 RepID=A0ABP7F4D7_9ACTN
MRRGVRPDPGLQPERTLMSWQRTLILVIVTTLLYVRDPFVDTLSAALTSPGATAITVARLFPALGVLVVCAVVLMHLRRRWRSTEHGRHDDATGRPAAPLARPWALIVVSLAVALLSAAVVVTAALN